MRHILKISISKTGVLDNSFAIYRAWCGGFIIRVPLERKFLGKAMWFHFFKNAPNTASTGQWDSPVAGK